MLPKEPLILFSPSHGKAKKIRSQNFRGFQLKEMDSSFLPGGSPPPSHTYFSPSAPPTPPYYPVNVVAPVTPRRLLPQFLSCDNEQSRGQSSRIRTGNAPPFKYSRSLVSGEGVEDFSFTSSCLSLSIFNLMKRSACMSADSSFSQCPMNRVSPAPFLYEVARNCQNDIQRAW